VETQDRRCEDSVIITRRIAKTAKPATPASLAYSASDFDPIVRARHAADRRTACVAEAGTFGLNFPAIGTEYGEGLP
jgi:hypothetical protein